MLCEVKYLLEAALSNENMQQLYWHSEEACFLMCCKHKAPAAASSTRNDGRIVRSFINHLTTLTLEVAKNSICYSKALSIPYIW